MTVHQRVEEGRSVTDGASMMGGAETTGLLAEKPGKGDNGA